MRLSESEYHHLLALSGQPVPQDVQEKRFMSQVVRLARELGLCVYHTHDSRHSAAGYPDLCIVDPRPLGHVGPGGLVQAMPDVLLIECKTQRGKITHAQELWLRALHGKTVVAEVWRPGDMAAIVAKLKGES